ncbi:MAG: DsbA family protein [Candidatus Woesearchaeota archaeon]
MKDKNYLLILGAILFLVVAIASFLEILFIVDYPSIDSLDTSLHNKLVFDDAYRGSNPDSNITFVYFISFSCPFSLEHHHIVKNLMVTHPDVNFLVKHLVDFQDDKDIFSAMAFECTNEQGLGYELASFFFSAQFTVDNAMGYIEMIGTDMNRFNQCMGNQSIQSSIQIDSIHASNIGVRGTPTTFVNGIKLEGVNTFEIYDELLKREKRE